MMKIEEMNLRKKPIVIIDESLDEYNNENPFPEKLAKANRMVEKNGLPPFKALKKEHS